jgi:hypothetical protein
MQVVVLLNSKARHTISSPRIRIRPLAQGVSTLYPEPVKLPEEERRTRRERFRLLFGAHASALPQAPGRSRRVPERVNPSRGSQRSHKAMSLANSLW